MIVVGCVTSQLRVTAACSRSGSAAVVLTRPCSLSYADVWALACDPGTEGARYQRRMTHRLVGSRGHVQAPRDGEAFDGGQEGHEGGGGQVRERRAAVQDRAIALIIGTLRPGMDLSLALSEKDVSSKKKVDIVANSRWHHLFADPCMCTDRECRVQPMS